MFYYISFLRPPPHQALPSQAILINPQIANDLRTELCPLVLDIFYRWLHLDSSLTPLTKLTTWREADAYKEVRLPPAKEVKDGQSWRLLLCARAEGSEATSTIDLSQTPFGESPFPVLSMPILFSSRTVKAANSGKNLSFAKQDQIERLFRIPEGITNAPLTVREHLSFDLDKKLWDSGIGLSYWLTSLMVRPSQAPEIARRIFNKGIRNVLELGAGTGLVSIVLAALLSNTSMALQASIVATDLPSAMDLIEHNISANEIFYPSIRPRAVVLDWDDEALPTGLQDGFDVILMADVTYNTASFPSLIRTLQRVVHLGSEPPLIVLGYKERDPAERNLWEMVRSIGIQFEEVHRVEGAGGAPIEIYTGYVWSH